MAVQYSGHWLRTRQQAVWQSIVLLLVLLPLAALQFKSQRLGVAMALTSLTVAPFAIAYHASRFLEQQERQHAEPTPEMAFVFRFIASTPLAFGGLLMVVLNGIR